MRAWKHNLRLSKVHTQRSLRVWQVAGLTFAAATQGTALGARPPGPAGLALCLGLDTWQVQHLHKQL